MVARVRTFFVSKTRCGASTFSTVQLGKGAVATGCNSSLVPSASLASEKAGGQEDFCTSVKTCASMSDLRLPAVDRSTRESSAYELASSPGSSEVTAARKLCL